MSFSPWTSTRSSLSTQTRSYARTDLKELIDLDLHGAPYGYTPMGDDNEEMEGFRFWKTGYWEQFLRGRPYHIR